MIHQPVEPAAPQLAIAIPAETKKQLQSATEKLDNLHSNLAGVADHFDKTAARKRLAKEATKKSPDFPKIQGDLELLDRAYRGTQLQGGRRLVKEAIKTVLVQASPLVQECVARQAEAVRKLFNAAEKPERAAAEKAGVEFEPSATLQRLQESFGRCRGRLSQLDRGRRPATETEVRAFANGGGDYIASGGVGVAKADLAELRD